MEIDTVFFVFMFILMFDNSSREISNGSSDQISIFLRVFFLKKIFVCVCWIDQKAKQTPSIYSAKNGVKDKKKLVAYLSSRRKVVAFSLNCINIHLI